MSRVSFPPVEHAQWLEKVERDLAKGPRGGDVERVLGRANLDDLPLRVLEHEETTPTAGDPAGLPGMAPFTRGARLPAKRAAAESWTIGLDIEGPELEPARAALMHDLALGAGAFRLRIRPGGLRLGGVECFRRLLAGVDLSIVEVLLDAGDPLLGAALLAEVGDPASLRGSLGADPIGDLASAGQCDLGAGFDSLAAAARWCRDEAPGLRAGELSALTWHDAGATPVQQLAFTLAAAAETLRQLEARGVVAEQAAPHLLAVFAVGRETFLEIAKLRAWRLLYSKLLAAAGIGAQAAGQRLAVLPSAVHLTRVDPWVNLLRAAAQTFAAACAGADVIITPRHDQRLGSGSGELQSRRISINLQHVLAQEAHLGRVADPAGGSWAIERMSDELARAAWQLFRDIEGAGGLVASLRAGEVQRHIAGKVELRRKRLRKRLDGIVGVSVFPLVGEERPGPAAEGEEQAGEQEEAGEQDNPAIAERSVDAVRTWLRQGARLSLLAAALRGEGGESCAKLEPFHSADDFERLRLAVDDRVAGGAERPRVLLAGLGSASEARARQEFAAGFFSVAGLETVAVGGFGDDRPLAELGQALASTGACAAVLCSSDERYLELAEGAARAASSETPGRVLLAGRPGENAERWRAAGITEFIYLGCDVASVLAALLESLDLLPAGAQS